MSDDAKARLQRLVAERKVVFLIGAGVSMQTTKNDPSSSWLGFMEAGIDIAKRRQPDTGQADQWAHGVRAEMDSDDPDRRLAAEDLVLNALGGRDSEHVARWLYETVGSLKIQDSCVVEALDRLDAPLLTLNYDGLLEQGTGRPSITWEDGPAMRAVVRGEQAGVIHLHGLWSNQGSVVLGSVGYEAIASVTAAQELVKSVSNTYFLVLVGFGAPLDSLHFKPLRQWLTENADARQIRLVTADELDYFQAPGLERERRYIEHVVYGADFGALAPFLESLRGDDVGDTEPARHALRKRLGDASPYGAALLILAVVPALGVTGVAPVLLAVFFAATMALAGAIYGRGRRSTLRRVLLWVCAGATIAAGLVSIPGPAPSSRESLQSEKPTSTADHGEARGPQTTVDQARPLSATTTSPARRTAVTRTEVRHVEFGRGPGTIAVLGMRVAKGETDYDDDGEDRLRRLSLRSGEQRCPVRSDWRNVYTGDQLEMTTRHFHYRVLVDSIDAAGLWDVAATVERVANIPRERAGCRRS